MFSGAGVTIFLVHQVVDMGGKLPAFDEFLTEERYVADVEGACAVTRERQSRARVSTFESREKFVRDQRDDQIGFHQVLWRIGEFLLGPFAVRRLPGIAQSAFEACRPFAFRCEFHAIGGDVLQVIKKEKAIRGVDRLSDQAGNVVLIEAAEGANMIAQVLFQHEFIGLDFFRSEVGVSLEIRASYIELFKYSGSSKSLSIQQFSRGLVPRVDKACAGIGGVPKGTVLVMPEFGSQHEMVRDGPLILDITCDETRVAFVIEISGRRFEITIAHVLTELVPVLRTHCNLMPVEESFGDREFGPPPVGLCKILIERNWGCAGSGIVVGLDAALVASIIIKASL